jgi:hypothetical protein
VPFPAYGTQWSYGGAIAPARNCHASQAFHAPNPTRTYSSQVGEHPWATSFKATRSRKAGTTAAASHLSSPPPPGASVFCLDVDLGGSFGYEEGAGAEGPILYPIMGEARAQIVGLFPKSQRWTSSVCYRARVEEETGVPGPRARDLSEVGKG